MQVGSPPGPLKSTLSMVQRSCYSFANGKATASGPRGSVTSPGWTTYPFSALPPRSFRNDSMLLAIERSGVADDFTSIGNSFPAVSTTRSTSTPADVLQKYSWGCSPLPDRRLAISPTTAVSKMGSGNTAARIRAEPAGILPRAQDGNRDGRTNIRVNRARGAVHSPHSPVLSNVMGVGFSSSICGTLGIEVNSRSSRDPEKSCS